MSPKVIVFGNEKGGTGKSTLAMHLVVSLLAKGYKVSTIDVDARQGTFSRYIENRLRSREEGADYILVPEHTPVFRSTNMNLEEANAEEAEGFNIAMQSKMDSDFIIVDTPGHDSNLSRVAHSYADVLITPMNDSFIDLDLLVRLKDATIGARITPSTYAEMVWEQKMKKAARNRGTIDWVVLRNRMSNFTSKNRQEIEKVLSALSKRIGFRLVKGFSERVIFREMFLSGLTLLDTKSGKIGISLSHIAARQELSDLLKSLGLEELPDEEDQIRNIG